MSKDHVYSVFKVGRELWQIVKYDKKLLTEEGVYMVSRTYRGEWLCDCLAGTGETCRHRQLVHIFTIAHKVDKGKKYDFDKTQWVE